MFHVQTNGDALCHILDDDQAVVAYAPPSTAKALCQLLNAGSSSMANNESRMDAPVQGEVPVVAKDGPLRLIQEGFAESCAALTLMIATAAMDKSQPILRSASEMMLDTCAGSLAKVRIVAHELGIAGDVAKRIEGLTHECARKA